MHAVLKLSTCPQYNLNNMENSPQEPISYTIQLNGLNMLNALPFS